MKSITSKLLLWLIFSTFLLLCVLLYHNYAVVYSHFRNVVERQASMALQFDLSIRKYAANNIRPLMYELLGQDEFIPATMSTSYIARSIFEDVRKEFPGYIIKFSSDNPRNPVNQAGPEELKIIKYLNENPQLKRWEGVISIDGKQYMGKFSARRMKESCLRCHGDPKDAPASLIRLYGDKAGFYRPMGEIIGMDMIAIPLSKITEGLWSKSMNTFVIIIVALVLFFFSSAIALRFLIIKRVEMIASHFRQVSHQEDYSRIEPIQIKGQDEISQLAKGFNSLTDRLGQVYASLENTVTLRTQALIEKNEELKKEIENHQRTEQSLKESEESFKNIINSSPMGVHLYTLKEGDRLVFTGANLASDKLLGVGHGQFMGKTIEEAFPGLTETEVPERYRNAAKNGVVWNTEQINYNEGLISGAFEVVAFQTEPGKMAVFFNEITARKRAEEALRDSEEKFRAFVEQSPLGISLIRKDGRYKYVNPRFHEMFGYTIDDFSTDKEWVKLAYPDGAYRQKVVSSWINDLKHTDTGHPRPQVYEVTCKDGSQKKIHFRPVTMENQDQIVIYEDVTERSKIQQQLQQTQKFEAIGTLAGGIAHDFNNLLMGIQGRASLISADLEPFHSYLEHTHAIEGYIRSATDLTKQLLGIARGGKYEVKPTDINELVGASANMFGRTKKEIQIHTRFHSPPPIVDVDRSQIEQVLLNLYINAWQAMPGGGELYLESQIANLDEIDCSPYQAKPGQYAKISVQDTGIGMDTDTRHRIFDPFFTTKEKGRGTGLGLASAYGIIQNHNGIIIVYSEVGHGTTFDIYLPLSDKDAYREVSMEEELVKGYETILLVDDEEMIIDVGKAMLEKLGYRVFVASGGEQAVEAVSAMGNEIDLVILDLIMPGMDGGRAFDRIRTIEPTLPVILASGYAIDGQAQSIMGRGCDGFIQKPFNMSELSQKVRKILGDAQDQS